MLIRFDRIEERDRWTDGQTDEQTVHHGIGRAYAQHRAKKTHIYHEIQFLTVLFGHCRVKFISNLIDFKRTLLRYVRIMT